MMLVILPPAETPFDDCPTVFHALHNGWHCVAVSGVGSGRAWGYIGEIYQSRAAAPRYRRHFAKTLYVPTFVAYMR